MKAHPFMGACAALLRFSALSMAITAATLHVAAADLPLKQLAPDRSDGQLMIDESRLRAMLSSAPLEDLARTRATSGVRIRLPLPDGRPIELLVEESPVMAAELASRYPQIRTYIARGAGIRGRLDITPKGFHAMLTTPEGMVLIDPRETTSGRHYDVYYRRDYVQQNLTAEPHVCLVEGARSLAGGVSTAIAAIPLNVIAAVSGSELRTYRIAVAVTGEYTNFHGGTVADGLSAVVTTLNRVNQIYERDVAVRLELVANNDQLIYTNGATDPYSNNDGIAMLGENQANTDAVIGSANYDIGHVFSTNGGGVSALGVACVDVTKARGVTGMPSPVGDPFDIDFVAHEIGHQLGATHSFNGTTGSCRGLNRVASSAYEPGSGSTIMAYAGVCGAENLQANSDAMFHAISIDQIVNFTTIGSGNFCASVSATNNNPPSVDAGPDYTIPANTPFELTGTASDPELDPLTYSWEQLDLGAASTPADMADNGDRPIFRSFLPTGEAKRTFPRLSDILNGSSTIGEWPPATSRILTFRLTARDGRGGINEDETVLTVDSVSGPFAVTAPNGGESINQSTTVTWAVANTDVTPVNCAAVDVLLSLDGGNTFISELLAGTPNDGAETTALPAGSSDNARIKVRCSDNVFFGISDAVFSYSATNNPPVANSDAFQVLEDSSGNGLDVLANDTDIDIGDTRTVTLADLPDQGGSLSIVGAGPDNTLSYTPAPGYVGVETFGYSMQDAAGVTATALVTVTVLNVNDPPQAIDDNLVVDEDSADNALDLLGNDTDPDTGDTRTITLVDTPDQGGTVTINGSGPNNAVSYAPAPGYVGAETFNYTVSDGEGATDVGSVTVLVNNVNDPPTGVADSYLIAEDSIANTLDVLANDTDPDVGDTRTITAVSAPDQGGSVSISGADANNTLSYSPPAGFVGTETFTYTFRDFEGVTDSALVTITVFNVNDPPDAFDDDFNVDEDSSSNTLDVLANDADADSGDTRTITQVAAPSQGGSVSLSGAGPDNTLSYTPAPGFVGTETFSYTMRDSAGATDNAAITITVDNVNDPPIATPDSYTVAEDSVANALDVLANDTDADSGDSRTITLVGAPDQGGSVSISGAGAGNTLSYTPAPSYAGTETFTYTMQDGAGVASVALVTVTVTGTNDPPDAVADSFSVAEDSGASELDVLANDTDPDAGDTRTITAFGLPDQGASISISGVGPDNTLSYTPAPGFVGTEAFSYTMRDAEGATDTATVSVTVTNVNDQPNAAADSYTVAEDSAGNALDVLANDTDPDSGDTKTIVAIGTPDRGGTVGISGAGADNSLTYAPAPGFVGTETFSYTLRDTLGAEDSAQVTLTIVNVNDPPNALEDAYTVMEDTVDHGLSVLANDTDPDAGDTLTIILVAAPTQGGSVTIVGAGPGNALRYSPAADFAGTETFSYTLRDAIGASDAALVTVTVANVNDPPTAIADNFDVLEDSNGNSLDVLANDIDPDNGDTRTIVQTSTPNQGGTVNLSGTDPGNTLIYTPAAGFVGTETFNYTVHDAEGAPGAAQVAITVANVNDPPRALDDVFALTVDSTDQRLDVLANDADPDSGDTRTITQVHTPDQGGSVDITGSHPDNTLSYTPAPGFKGIETFSYTIEDAAGLSATANVAVTVYVNAAPDAVPDNFTVARDSHDNVLHVLANDTDANSDDTQRITAVSAASHNGSVDINNDGPDDVLVYSPAAGFEGTETLSYSVQDAAGAVDQATVTITVTGDPRAKSASTGIGGITLLLLIVAWRRRRLAIRQ